LAPHPAPENPVTALAIDALFGLFDFSGAIDFPSKIPELGIYIP
jgi:hypothetical protein